MKYPMPWIELVGFLRQNYVTLHNNLVNMIFLLEYFSHQHKCMYMKQSSCKLISQECHHPVTLQNLILSVDLGSF